MQTLTESQYEKACNSIRESLCVIMKYKLNSLWQKLWPEAERNTVKLINHSGYYANLKCH